MELTELDYLKLINDSLVSQNTLLTEQLQLIQDNQITLNTTFTTLNYTITLIFTLMIWQFVRGLFKSRRRGSEKRAN